MKTEKDREVSSKIVEKYLTDKEINKELFNDGNYDKGYSDAIQMVLSVLRDEEIAEVKRFYNFSKVFKENC